VVIVAVGDQQPLELLNDDKAWADEPRRLAEDVCGHKVEDDTVTQERLTCTSCGRAVIRVGCNIYGSAVMVGCQFTDAGRRYNADNKVRW
jgi:hypothetical protein